MIPDFPQFKKLSLDDNDEIEAYNKKFPYYSDYNFTSLWCWDIDNKRELSFLNNNLVIKFSDYATGQPFFTFLGVQDTCDTAKKLLDYSDSVGVKPELRLVPEISIHDISSNELKITADPDNFDYIYLTARMAGLSGNQYRYKRQDAERFVGEHPTHSFEIADLSQTETRDAITRISRSWRVFRGIDEDDQSINHEAEAIQRLFELLSCREIVAGLIRIDGEPTAFTIEEIVSQAFSIGHFWKTAQRIRGEYEFMARSMAAYLQSRDVIYWNWEQDLGLKALHDSKMSYRPSDFLKKFTITRSTSGQR